MDKIFSLIIVILASTNFGFAQSKSYVGIIFGPSIPIEAYGSKDINTEYAGYADRGSFFNININYKWTDDIGIVALLNVSSQPFDNKRFVDNVSASTPGIYWEIDANRWRVGGFMLGLYRPFTLKNKNKNYLELRGMIGFLTTTSPELNMYMNDGTSYAIVEQSSVSVSSFSYLIGTVFNLNLQNNLRLLVNIDILQTTPEFENIEQQFNDGSINYHLRNQYQYSI